ncbi:MAG: hypothetical protein G01um101419_782 [Parcubacteria group bacterium Gr01-1014_19]|nr:MAG: hypothetical protein G01um101419_782 [Parcubacteria group bacterium Gr01-1014_19]
MAATTSGKARLFDLMATVMELVRDGERDEERVANWLQKVKYDPKFDELGRPDVFGKQSLKKLIKLGRFVDVDDLITAANFPDIGVKTDFKVYYSGEIDYRGIEVSAYDFTVEQMAKEGYCPANLRELLTWMVTNWNGTYSVLALDQIYRDDFGLIVVPCLRFDGERVLSLESCAGSFASDDRFLAVRNS